MEPWAGAPDAFEQFGHLGAVAAHLVELVAISWLPIDVHQVPFPARVLLAEAERCLTSCSASRYVVRYAPARVPSRVASQMVEITTSPN